MKKGNDNSVILSNSVFFSVSVEFSKRILNCQYLFRSLPFLRLLQFLFCTNYKKNLGGGRKFAAELRGPKFPDFYNPQKIYIIL